MVNGQFPQGQFTHYLGFVGSVLVTSIGHHLILPFEHVESGLGMSERRHTVLGLAVGIALCLSVQCELAFIYGVNGKNGKKKKIDLMVP